ncbi:hypothetical protein N7474_001827 [Penicillium riverlandense]|uniref:uncharacterized protein n=1 Tax=Penicillium riverlandense TaxID=1903569 RepID=UPI002548E641|nr:uncharacterized protein N7474_001827 [Penicillium riverlandense]KAJ5833516.1 hypothetical protein N7474_001827 [Penicillium riverlandense]
MPHIANTPESLLPRSDSRNPATTCRGITTSGRPCRRSLASQNHANSWNGCPLYDTNLYCWQHKDQAVASASTWADPSLQPEPEPRSSVDTLLDRLGVLEVSGQHGQPTAQQRHCHGRKRADVVRVKEKHRPPPKRTFCCFEIVDDEDMDRRIPQPVTRPVQLQQVRPARRPASAPQNLYQQGSRPNSVPQRMHASLSPTPQHSRPSSSGTGLSPTPQTQSLLSWIPPSLSPQTTSLLLTELAKPISATDEEGYIYMFWVTPPSTTRNAGSTSPRPPPREIASSLLLPVPNSSRPAQRRSISDAIRVAQDLNALSSNPTATAPGTVRLKIGRAINVHRRLTEWTRQCSNDLTLIRYYPYSPSTSTTTPTPQQSPSSAWLSPSRHNHPQQRPTSSETLTLTSGRKVPHVHRVERLIHIELADLRVRDLGPCAECGKEHREWFEIEACKDALRRVDECVRRWVSWAGGDV